MSTVTVVYKGYAPAVAGGGFVFVRGEPVEVPRRLAETLGPDFNIKTRKGGEV